MSTERDYGKFLKIIAKNIKRLRTEHGYTQEDMMDLGFNYRFYQKLESGRYSPNLRTIHRLAMVFKSDIPEFFKR